MDFSVHETQEMGGEVPDGLAVEVTGGTCRMRGTDHSPPRCAALTGKVGSQAACGIYEWRPHPAVNSPQAARPRERARLRHGLPPYPAGVLYKTGLLLGDLKSESATPSRIEVSMSKKTYEQIKESERHAIALGLQQNKASELSPARGQPQHHQPGRFIAMEGQWLRQPVCPSA